VILLILRNQCRLRMQIYGQLVQTIYQKKPFMFHRMTMHDLEYKIYETGKLSMKFPQ